MADKETAYLVALVDETSRKTLKYQIHPTPTPNVIFHRFEQGMNPVSVVIDKASGPTWIDAESALKQKLLDLFNKSGIVVVDSRVLH